MARSRRPEYLSGVLEEAGGISSRLSAESSFDDCRRQQAVALEEGGGIVPDPRCLEVGDLVRFVSLPDEWSVKDFSVSQNDIAFMKRMIKRSWPSRVFVIDEYGDPWISARILWRGKYQYHTWKIAESTGWRQVRRRRAVEERKNG